MSQLKFNNKDTGISAQLISPKETINHHNIALHGWGGDSTNNNFQFQYIDNFNRCIQFQFGIFLEKCL